MKKFAILIFAFFPIGAISTVVAAWLFTPAEVQETVEPEPEVVQETVEIQPTIPDVDLDQMHCLAKNIYFEARGESSRGKTAVANVTINRVNSTRYPNTVCDVVYQAVHSTWWKENHNRLVPVKNMCQFTWYCDGKSDAIMLTDYQGRTIKANMDAWIESIAIARMALEGKLPDLTQGATHYFNPRLASPKWQYAFTQVAIIDNHAFFVH
jgi:spore germination cell wall hydrolase CwlJ-like protein